jgi:SAM-dependent methyltransferase
MGGVDLVSDGSHAATPAGYFDRMWSTGPDPWDHGGRFYEHRKYALTAATLQSERYGAIFEPGCATGILTALLAPRAERYVATDRHPRAVSETRRRLTGVAPAAVEQGRIPADWPDGTFDAVILSEVLYYLEPDDVVRCLDRAAAGSRLGAELVAVHYREPVDDHALLGDEVHALIDRHPAWTRESRHVEARFVLEGFRRR